MNPFIFLLRNFFTHRDFLPESSAIPGTMFSPLHIVYESVFIVVIVACAVYVGRRKHLIKSVFTGLWIALVVLEILIDLWEIMAGAHHNVDLSIILPLYPCSIFMYVLPFIIWGKGVWNQIACGYVCTLGLTGALINFLYPSARLVDYSCISFPGFHTFLFHGSMLFAVLVLLISGVHCYHRISNWWSPLLASLPGLVFSVPANILNYSPVHSDYMYFTGQHFMSKAVFGRASPIKVTIAMYGVYILGPALFYWVPVAFYQIFKTVSANRTAKPGQSL